VNELESGGVHYITPGDAECEISSYREPDNGNLCPIRTGAWCYDGGEIDLSALTCVTLSAARGGAHGHYQFWFRVKPAVTDPGTTPATPNFVPIHIFAPDVIWDLGLSNGSVSETAGVATATYYLRLRSDPVGDLSSRGTVVAETPVLLASHGGIHGCLSIPTGFDDVANLAISCLAATNQEQQGKSSPSISAVVEVGRTYSVELAADFYIEKRVTLKPTSLEVSRRMNETPGPIGTVLKWNKFVITVGSATDDLQAQIDALQAQVDELRGDFDHHSHTYLTGKGVGHNNVEASTGLPWYWFPDDAAAAADSDGDGVIDLLDACPGSQLGELVDATGCTASQACSSRPGRSACRRGR